MSVVTSPFDPPLAPPVADKPIRVRGTAEVRVDRDAGRSRLAHSYATDPLKLLYPTPAAGDPPTAVLATTSGGLVGGDELDITAEADDGAALMVTAQAAEKLYRSTGPECRVDVTLAAGRESWLEWLPQETILFENARLRRRTRLEITASSRVLAGELLVFGRVRRGEELTEGLVRDAWEIRRDGRLIWADALHMDGDLTAPLAHPAGFAGARAYATAVIAAPGVEARLEDAREWLEGGFSTVDPSSSRAFEARVPKGGVRAGLTAFDGLLIGRWLSDDPLALRTAFGGFWAVLRHDLGGVPARLPRLWSI